MIHRHFKPIQLFWHFFGTALERLWCVSGAALVRGGEAHFLCSLQVSQTDHREYTFTGQRYPTFEKWLYSGVGAVLVSRWERVNSFFDK